MNLNQIKTNLINIIDKVCKTQSEDIKIHFVDILLSNLTLQDILIREQLEKKIYAVIEDFTDEYWNKDVIEMIDKFIEKVTPLDNNMNVLVYTTSDLLPEYATEGAKGLDIKAYFNHIPTDFQGRPDVNRVIELHGAYYTTWKHAKESQHISTEICTGEYEDETKGIVINANGWALIHTGVYLALPLHEDIQVFPRSGLALKQGLTCLNSPGLIDSDYRGEIGVVMINHSSNNYFIVEGIRVAQLIPSKPITWQNVASKEELPPTQRADKGFGHTNN